MTGSKSQRGMSVNALAERNILLWQAQQGAAKRNSEAALSSRPPVSGTASAQEAVSVAEVSFDEEEKEEDTKIMDKDTLCDQVALSNIAGQASTGQPESCVPTTREPATARVSRKNAKKEVNE